MTLILALCCFTGQSHLLLRHQAKTFVQLLERIAPLVKFSDDPFTVCKSCEKEGGVHKLLPGQMNFILKGGGWYKDGYSSSKKIGDVDAGEVQPTTACQPDRQDSSSA